MMRFIEAESLVKIPITSTQKVTSWRVCGVQWHPKGPKLTPEIWAFLFYPPCLFSTSLTACRIALSAPPETGSHLTRPSTATSLHSRMVAATFPHPRCP